MRVAPVVLVICLAACAGRAAPSSVAASHGASTPRVTVRITEPVLRAYAQTLTAWMTPEEIGRLAEVDYTDTARGDAQRLRYLAADHVVRVLLPRALEARGEPTLLRYARLLRRLPPLLDPDTDAVAAPVVRLALEGLERSLEGLPVHDPFAARATREGDTPRVEDAPAADTDLEDTLASAVALDAVRDLDPDAEREVAEALASYAQAYARRHRVSALEADAIAAAASDAVDTALLHERAVTAWGLPREVVVQEAIALAGRMAEAARRRERLPRRPRPDPPTAIPPDAPGSPTRP